MRVGDPHYFPMTPHLMNNLLGQLPFQTGAVTRMINAENPTGEKGGGAKWEPNPNDPMTPHSAQAMHLGRGWKVRPFISLKAGETATAPPMSTAAVVAIAAIFAREPWVRFIVSFRKTIGLIKRALRDALIAAP